MPIVRIAELEIDPQQIESYKALLAEEIEASVRVEPGVIFLHAVSVKGAPEKVRVIECYADHAAYEAHLTTPHFLNYKTQRRIWSGLFGSSKQTRSRWERNPGKFQTDPLPAACLDGKRHGRFARPAMARGRRDCTLRLIS